MPEQGSSGAVVLASTLAMVGLSGLAVLLRGGGLSRRSSWSGFRVSEGGRRLLGLGAFAVVLAVPVLAAAATLARRGKRKRVSVWWDVYAPPTMRHLDRHLANLKALGSPDVVVMLTEPEGRVNFAESELVDFAKALRSVGSRLVGIDTWIHPNPQSVAGLPGLFSLAKRTGVDFIEFDVEGNWTPGHVSGYSSLDEAARAVVSAMRGSPVPWGVTTNMGRIGGAARTLAQHGSFIVPQAYSVAHSDELGGALPGRYQIQAHRRTRDLYGSMPMVMGLAAFDQQFPGIDPTDAIVTAAKTSFGLGVKGVRFWSWKWIGGPDGEPKAPYAYEALMRLNRDGLVS